MEAAIFLEMTDFEKSEPPEVVLRKLLTCWAVQMMDDQQLLHLRRFSWLKG